MKVQTKCALALTGLLLASTIGTTSFAKNAPDYESTGKVEVKDGEDTNPPGVIDPEKPDPDPIDPVDPIDPNPDKGPMKIEYVSPLDFGEIETSANDVVSFAKAVPLKNGENRGHMIQFADIRGASFGYKIQVKMEKQFTLAGSTNKLLKGATISYANPILRAEVGNTNVPPRLVNGNTHIIGDGIDVGVSGSTTPQLSANLIEASESLKQGKGRYVAEFGQSPAWSNDKAGIVDESYYKADSAANSVKLDVPKVTASSMEAGKYVSNLLWVMTPGNP